MNLSSQIRSKINKRAPLDEYDDQCFIEIHHIFMTVYGWIPIDEFKKIPLPMMYNFLYYINRDNEKASKGMPKK